MDFTDLGNLVKGVFPFEPQSDTGGTEKTSDVIDRQEFNSLVAVIRSGDMTGAPTAVSSVWKLQHGPNADGTGMVDVTGATATITEADQTVEMNVDLTGLKRYIRLAETTTFTDGTSPSILLGAAIVLGGAQYLPQ